MRFRITVRPNFLSPPLWVSLALVAVCVPKGAGAQDAKPLYTETFHDLYEKLGAHYPGLGLKKIDWKAVGEQLLPRAKDVKTDEQFGLLVCELVARLEDSHAYVAPGTAKPPRVAFPQWDAGFACLVDDRGKPVVYHVDRKGPAAAVGLRPGVTVVKIDDKAADQAIDETMKHASRYASFSSERLLRYQSTRWFVRQHEHGKKVKFEFQDTRGRVRKVTLPCTLGVSYLPRLPVPVAGASDSANVSWTKLKGNVGYIYVRRIRNDLIARLDAAVGELAGVKGMIIDVRGNSGGGFDSRRSHVNFDRESKQEPDRPRFKGPMAVLIDARCISAGEGWTSWFIAEKRARVFGQATAGASSRKTTYTLKNGMYRVTFPVKLYRGYLDRPIERVGLVPDVPVMQNAKDLSNGKDTVLETARQYLMSKPG
jgi:C-terminal processing protease CtpA/Prc